MKRRILNWLIDRTKLLLTAVLIGVSILAFTFLLFKVIPEPVGTGVVILVDVAGVIWYVSVCKRRGLSIWTGSPFTTANHNPHGHPDSEGNAASKHNDTP